MRLIRELRGEISELENSELEESERQSLKQLHTVIVLSHNFLQAFCYLNKACQTRFLSTSSRSLSTLRWTSVRRQRF